MRHSLLKTLPSAFALLLLATPAAACISTPEQRQAEFDHRDTDGSGFLSLAEYYGDEAATNAIPQETKEKTFAALDLNSDGVMSFDEYNAQRQKTRC